MSEVHLIIASSKYNGNLFPCGVLNGLASFYLSEVTCKSCLSRYYKFCSARNAYYRKDLKCNI